MASRSPSFLQRCKPVVCVIGGVVCLYGASWQYVRKTRKIEYLKTINNALSSDPIDCPIITNENDDQYNHKKVIVTGIMDSQNNIIISPRNPPLSYKHLLRKQLKNKRTEIQVSGGYVYSPIITDDGHEIMVNRGWVEEEQINDYINQDNKENKSISIEGLMSALPKIPEFIKNKTNINVDANIWPFMDNELLKERFGGGDKEHSCTVVDAISYDDVNDNKTSINYPYPVHSSDLVSVNIPPFQHSIYIFLMTSCAFACFYYAHHFRKNPMNLITKNKHNLLKNRNRTRLDVNRNNKKEL